jgi:hypothetical protein
VGSNRKLTPDPSRLTPIFRGSSTVERPALNRKMLVRFQPPELLPCGFGICIHNPKFEISDRW